MQAGKPASTEQTKASKWCTAVLLRPKTDIWDGYTHKERLQAINLAPRSEAASAARKALPASNGFQQVTTSRQCMAWWMAWWSHLDSTSCIGTQRLALGVWCKESCDRSQDVLGNLMVGITPQLHVHVPFVLEQISWIRAVILFLRDYGQMKAAASFCRRMICHDLWQKARCHGFMNVAALCRSLGFGLVLGAGLGGTAVLLLKPGPL